MRFPPFNPYIAIFIAVISLSTTAILVKLANNVPSGMLAFYRLFFAVIIMAPLMIIKYRKELRAITKRDWMFTFIAGFFLALHFIIWFESLNYTSVASSVIILSLQPIFAFIGTYFFFGERFSVATIISIIITFIGSFIIGFGDFQLNKLALFGDIFTIVAAICVTGYYLLGQRLRRSLSLIPYTFIAYSISAMILLFYNIVMQNNFFSYSIDYWFIFIALAIVPTFLGTSLLNWALKWLSTSKISLAVVFEPIVASVFAYFILDEVITSLQWLGGTVVIFGLFLFIVSTTKKKAVTISKLNGD